MKKKITICLIFSCIVLVGTFSVSYLIKAADVQSATGHPFDLDSVADKTKEIGFSKLLKTELEKEGYNTISYMIVEQGRKESRVTIGISAKEYKGKQTENKIKRIVNRLAKENQIGTFLLIFYFY